MQTEQDKPVPFEASLRVVGLFAFWFLLALGMSAMGLSLGLGKADRFVADAFEALVLAFPPLVWVHLRVKHAGLSVETLMGTLPERRAWVQWGVLGLALAGFGLGTGWATVAFVAASQPDYFSELSAAQEGLTSAWPAVHVSWQVIDGLLLGPFVLELVFRGVVLRRFAYLWGVRSGVQAAVLLFALLHGLLHLDPVGSAALGLVTCLLYLETRCLWVPMFVHAVASAAQLAIMWAIASGPVLDDIPSTLDALRWPATWAALFSAPVLVILTRRLFARLPDRLPELS